jgi:hypothetical protein
MSYLRRTAAKIVPRALIHVASAALRGVKAKSAAKPGKPTPKKFAVPDTHPRVLRYLIGDPILIVPMEKVRYSDGRRYSYEEHHFMQYYKEGLAGLRRFYEVHQPADIFEKHFLKSPKRDRIPTDGVPWFDSFLPAEFEGECGLGMDHGDQAFGPVSEAKLQLEAERLDRVLKSIRERGFLADLGYPRGYLMLRTTGEWVFTIREGFHRVAAMAHLGYEQIEVQFFRDYPRFVEEADSIEWPNVKNESLTRQEALAIFARFFPPSAASDGTLSRARFDGRSAVI